MGESIKVRIHDKLVNLIAGLGTAGDKASHTQDVFVPISDKHLSEMYASNWMIYQIINMPVDDALRRPREISCPSLDGNITEFNDFIKGKKISLHKKTKKLMKWARIYGGAAFVLGVDGQGDNDKPLTVEKIKPGDLKFIHVVPRTKLQVTLIDQDVTSINYGNPSMYTVGGKQLHESRVYPIKGIELPEDVTTTHQFWGMSLIHLVDEPVKQARTILSQLSSMIFEANIDVIGVSNLRAMMASKDGQKQLIERFRLGNILKSNQQMMLFDRDMETYERKNLEVGRFPDLIVPFMQVVSACSDIPATRFLGKSPDGMNATGEGDESIYLDKLETIRTEDLDPLYEWLDPIILMSTYGHIPDDWGYSWPDMHQTDEAARAEVDNKDGDTDTKFLTMGIINEYHVADRILKSGRYPALTEENVMDLKEAAEIAKNQMGLVDPEDDKDPLDPEDDDEENPEDMINADNKR